jgi:hypothetical protein
MIWLPASAFDGGQHQGIVVKTTACSGFERVRLELGLRANFY